MTFEKRCFIKPEDIRGIRLRCVKCKATVTIPLEKVIYQKLAPVLMQNCAHCDTPSGFMPDTNETHFLLALSTSIRELGEKMKGRNIEYSFEIECNAD